MSLIHRLLPQTVTKAVIFLHGVGANGQDLLGLSSFLQPALPSTVAYIAPDGFDPYDMLPVGMVAESYQWFSLKDRSPVVLSAEVDRAAVRFQAFFEEIRSDLALDYSDIVLVGFSQGTMLAITAALQLPSPVAGVVGFSGAFLPPSSVHSHPAFCLIHGKQDEVIPSYASQKAAEDLKQRGCLVDCFVDEGLGHSIDERGIQRMAKYASQWLNPIAA
ncbi:MAG: alpha/beta hydrolase [bacterium]|jgi:phospholipase/carboxylesterase